MNQGDENARLRVVDESDSPSEEVLRLKRDRSADRVQAEAVARLPAPPPPEAPTRLDAGVVEDERRSHEPDIDAIIDGHEEAPDPEENWSGSRNPVPYGWFVLIAVAVAVAVVASTWFGRPDEPTEGDVARSAAVERVVTDEATALEAQALVDSVERRITAYLRAGSIEDKLVHVRDPDRVRPLMERWHAIHGFRPREFRTMRVFEPINLGSRTFWRAVVTVGAADGDEDLEPILLEQFADGSVKVDWETSVCYQPMDWDEYVRERPEGQGMDFRVMCVPDRGGLYSHEFRDDSVWRGFELTTRNAEEYAIGYLRRGTTLERRIYELFRENGGRPLALVLRLSRPAGTQSPRGVVIEEMVSPNWVIVDES